MKKLTRNLIVAALLLPAGQAAADIVHLDDVIIDGSLCTGFDCVDGESFGFDTIRVKENNLRIKFQDTSASASFPSNDWQITANDSANGGLNKFSIDDIDGGRTPFTIEASAPSHSLYVDDGGRLGLGTSTPVVDAHVVSGNTPTLRLEQNGSSGFTPQTWDVAGNEANFFIRDATNGSTLPFRILPGAPSNSLYIAPNGYVGIGNSSPQAPMHVFRNDDVQEFLWLEHDVAGPAQDRIMMDLRNNGGIRFEFKNKILDTEWRFQAATGNQDNFEVTKVGTGQLEMRLDSVGNLTITGNLSQNSDRNVKRDIESVDGFDILTRLDRLPLSEWSYIADPEGVRHVGPMAQDFYAAFGLGADETKIAPGDMAGISLAAVKSLSARNAELERRVAELEHYEQTGTELKRRIEELEYFVKQIAAESGMEL